MKENPQSDDLDKLKEHTETPSPKERLRGVTMHRKKDMLIIVEDSFIDEDDDYTINITVKHDPENWARAINTPHFCS